MLLTSLVVLSISLAGSEHFAEAAGAYYGRIIIEGNEDTPDSVILGELEFRPGQKVTAAAMRAARERLRACGAFRSNPWRGTGPTVELVPNVLDSGFVDVRIRIQERPGNWLVFGLAGAIESAMYLDAEGVLDEFDRIRRRATEEGAQKDQPDNHR